MQEFTCSHISGGLKQNWGLRASGPITRCNWDNICPQEIGEGKDELAYVWQ